MARAERKADAKIAYQALMKFYPFTLDDLDGEEWRPISGYEERYHISNYGRVKSFWHGKQKILKSWCTHQGYLCVNLTNSISHRQRNFRVNRLVAIAFVPNTDNKPDVNHRDGCKLNNYVNNLEWCTQQENIKHALEINLKKIGVESTNAKLAEEQVFYIRENTDNLTQMQLAKTFHVCQATISAIQRRLLYKDVGGQAKTPPGVPLEIRNKIRAEYVRRDTMFGAVALAKKYGCCTATIRRIIHEQD